MADTILNLLGGGSWAALSDHLCRYYVNNPKEQERRQNIRGRLALYTSESDGPYVAAVRSLFKNNIAINSMVNAAPLALANNVTRRVIDTIAIVYNEVPTRNLDDDYDQAIYDSILEDLKFDLVMRQANRMTMLTNDVFLWPYVQKGIGDLVLDVVTGKDLYWICDPWHPKTVIGVLIDQWPTRLDSDKSGHHLLLTPWESVLLDVNCTPLEGTYRPHSLGRLPGVIVHREEPILGCYSTGPGSDIVRTHLEYAIFEGLKAKEQKSGGKQATLRNPTADSESDFARGQARDDESILELPPGYELEAVDFTVDVGFRGEAQKDAIQAICAAYSIPPTLFESTYNATSGYQLDMLRQPLRERRMEQEDVFRRAERELAVLISDITGVFSTVGWNIDFAEWSTPASPIEELNLYIGRRDALLTNVIEELMKNNPDLTEEQATEIYKRNFAIRAAELKAAQAANAALTSTPEEAGLGPEVNGSLGGRPPADGGVKPDNNNGDPTP